MFINRFVASSGLHLCNCVTFYPVIIAVKRLGTVFSIKRHINRDNYLIREVPNVPPSLSRPIYIACNSAI